MNSTSVQFPGSTPFPRFYKRRMQIQSISPNYNPTSQRVTPMKTTIISTLLLLSLCITGAQAKTAFNKGEKVAQIGIGIGGLGGGYGSSSLPVISAGLDFGIEKFISVGGVVGYSASKFDYPFFVGNVNSAYSWKYTYFTLAVRGSYHFLQIPEEKFDVYGGLSLGYNIVSAKSEGTNINQVVVAGASGSYLFFGIHAGGRYYFSNTFAAYAELGYGLGILNVGIAMKI
jgi:hypothetical protein